MNVGMNKKISLLLLFFTILYAKTIDSTHIKEKIKQLHKVANEAYKKDDYELSLSYYKEVLLIEQKIYGEEHIDTLDSYKQLSSIYFIIDNQEESLKYYKIIVTNHPLKKRISPKNRDQSIKFVDSSLPSSINN